MSALRRLAETYVAPIGFGAMHLSRRGAPDMADCVRTIHAAIDAGVTLIDTADAYAPDDKQIGHNERLLSRALGRHHRDKAVIATKGGALRRDDAWKDDHGKWLLDGSPRHLRSACERSLRTLNTDRIDLYQLHRPDPRVPYEESVGALKELQDEGKVRWIGICNANVDQITVACSVATLASVQNQLSLDYPFPIDRFEIAACENRKLALLAWSPLGGAGRATAAARPGTRQSME